MAEQSMFQSQRAAPGDRNCYSFDPKSTCPGQAHDVGWRFSEIKK
jgi:hypothetical protein